MLARIAHMNGCDCGRIIAVNGGCVPPSTQECCGNLIVKCDVLLHGLGEIPPGSFLPPRNMTSRIQRMRPP